MQQSSTEKRNRRKLKRVITRQDLPVLNPRDLIDPIGECILELDPHAEFILMITDPRDHRAMSIRTCLHEQTKGTFLRTLTTGLWPLDEDEYAPAHKKVQAFDPAKETKENQE